MLLRQLPPGTQPPLVIDYSASSVPILQLGLSGPGMSEQELNDLGLNFLRPQLVTVPGSVIPYPYGGKQRQVMIPLNPTLLQSKGLSPSDVLNSVAMQYLVLPSGTVKISQTEYDVRMNATPTTVQRLNDLPIKTVGMQLFICVTSPRSATDLRLRRMSCDRMGGAAFLSVSSRRATLPPSTW
jgi:multidrug efflux pump subunit AcrB